jgi:protein-S-isoprenylcysteine O-methyltransferase Ste14
LGIVSCESDRGAAALFFFFDLKSRQEERWLAEAYAGYQDYQRRVRKLIPWIY